MVSIFYLSSILSFRLTGIQGGHGTSFIFFCLFGTIYSTYNSAWASSVCPVAIKADSWVLLGYTYGLVSSTPTCAFHVPTRRATLLEPYSGAFRLIIARRASLRITTTVLLPCHRKISTVSRR